MQARKFRVFSLLGVLLVTSLVLVACGASETPTSSIPDQPTATLEEHDEGEEQEHSESEDQDTAHDDDEAGEHDEDDYAEVPEEYDDLTNPLSGEADAISSGSTLFIANCAMCHGETGDADGPASSALDPKPARLSDAETIRDLSDAYLFWRISEGGTMNPFNSAMPAWKGIYGEEQIWQLVTFIRSLSK